MAAGSNVVERPMPISREGSIICNGKPLVFFRASPKNRTNAEIGERTRKQEMT